LPYSPEFSWGSPSLGTFRSFSKKPNGPSREEPWNSSSTPDGITSEQIRDELARSGRVIRENATKAGEAISDAATNTRISAAIKTKLLQEAGLSAFNIDVDTSAGVVTLSGTVSSPEQISRAMELALQTEGVHKVVSTLQLKPK
jgi:hypothetical protein